MKKIIILLSLIVTNANVFAEDFIINGVELKQYRPAPSQRLTTLAQQYVPVLSVALSDKLKGKINHRLGWLNQSKTIFQSTPSSVQLGMENTPVLDQGIHGSCVVFAITAAIDAILKKGDYVSPLCSLQLGSYLQSFGYFQSGWQGSLAYSSLAQFDAFGFVNTDKQKQVGCGGLFEYPLFEKNYGQAMSLEDFHQHSESLTEYRIGWSSVLDIYQSSHEDIDMQNILTQVKTILFKGDRLIIGVLLADSDKGVAGAVGTHKDYNDTWLLTPEITQEMKQSPQYVGHALLVTGYDDNAYAKDDYGRIYRGLVTLRNSWGDKVGEHGNFYMSYDYFKTLVMEIQRIRQLNSEH